MIIAIDGPAGSGKSSVARLIAKKLCYRHIDTGAMYRAVAWQGQQLGIDLADEEAVADMAQNLALELLPGPEGQRLCIAGQDVTDFLKTETVGRGAATVASLARVRKILVDKQRAIGKNGSVVMDGRDIGTVVFPHADRKFFLEADPRERGRRRYEELKDKNPDLNLESIIRQVKARDHEDRNRAVSPLCKAEDAVLIDTTCLNIDEVVDEVIRRIKTP